MFFFFISVAPEIRAVPSEGVLIVKEGEPASLACEIIKGNPTPEITWKRKVRQFKQFFPFFHVHYNFFTRPV